MKEKLNKALDVIMSLLGKLVEIFIYASLIACIMGILLTWYYHEAVSFTCVPETDAKAFEKEEYLEVRALQENQRCFYKTVPDK